ncbi:MAG: enoyl-CoA hydratase-related protein, partial [Caldimonas sp.]
GDKLPAVDAERLGMIWKCVDDAAFAEEVNSTAQRLAGLPTRALVATRQAIDDSQQLDYGAALSHEGSLQATLSSSHDYLEGVAAFLAKRRAVFSDR